MEEQLIRIFITQGDSGSSLNGWSILFLASIWLMAVVTSPFLMSRAKNLATKKDIADITLAIESVKHQFDLLKEMQQQRNRLSLAAIDTRLRVHQEAFVHWHDTLTASSEEGESVAEKARNAERWLVKNSVYLGDEVQISLKEALIAASIRAHTLKYGSKEDKKDNWDLIMAAGKTIMESVVLPGFSDKDVQKIGD